MPLGGSPDSLDLNDGESAHPADGHRLGLVVVNRELAGHLLEVLDGEDEHLRVARRPHRHLTSYLVSMQKPVVNLVVIEDHTGEYVSGAEHFTLLDLQVGREFVTLQNNVHLALHEEVEHEYFVLLMIHYLILHLVLR